MYHVSRASSYADDSSYDIATVNSDGESDGNDDSTSTQELTAKAAKQLHRARGTANTNARSKQRNKKLPPKSHLPGGSAIKMLANKASPAMNKESKIVGHFYHNNMQAKMAAINYEFFSEIPCLVNPVHESNDLAVTYTHTLQTTNKSKVLEVIRALVDGGANGRIGGRDMKVIAWHPQQRKVNHRKKKRGLPY